MQEYLQVIMSLDGIFVNFHTVNKSIYVGEILPETTIAALRLVAGNSFEKIRTDEK